MRHAQYRQELADTIAACGVRKPAVDVRNPNQTPPAITVVWAGSKRDRAQGWFHDYEVEIVGAGYGLEFDTLVQRVATAMADWKPSTSAARPQGPTIDHTSVAGGDPAVTYPVAVLATVVNEPND